MLLCKEKKNVFFVSFAFMSEKGERCGREHLIRVKYIFYSVVVHVCECVSVYEGGRDGEQTWLTVWISSCCKSASVTDGRPLIAGL